MMPAISRYMTSQPWTIERTASLAEAHKLMRDHQIRHLPILDEGRLIGIVSQGDLHLLETVADFALDSVSVEEAMTPNPCTVTSDMPLDDVVEIMSEKKYGAALVMGRDGVEGIFTTVEGRSARPTERPLDAADAAPDCRACGSARGSGLVLFRSRPRCSPSSSRRTRPARTVAPSTRRSRRR